ncbi:mitochondrial import receptor subunit tom20 [Coemansia sp. RSA 1821]|nr:mitochondrial import receptor subunit tom20 [Coemansia sp. RSA 1821]
MVSGKNIAVAASVTAVVAGISYLAYFDYKRRNDPKFRRKLKRSRKKAEKTAEKISGDASLDEINSQALELLNIIAQEKLPESPEEKEKFFMAQVSRGEALCGAGPSGYADAACRFFQALKVYPNPVELVMIYQKTTPDIVFKLVMAMMAQEVQQKQARYFDVFPPEDKHVRIKDKNKKESKKQTKSDDAKEVVVPNRALFTTKEFAEGDVVYEEDSVVSTLLPCAQNGQFCHHCLRKVPEAVDAAKEDDSEAKEGGLEEQEPAAEKQEPSKSSAFECDKCHESVYCSEKCRQDAYDAYHQYLCPSSSSSTAREFAELAKKTHELAPVLIAKFFGILVDREKKKELARALGVSEKQKTEADEYTTWEHLESMRYLELIPTASDAQVLRKLGELMSNSVPGLNEFVTSERYSMLKGKLDYNAYAVHGSDVPKETESTHVSDTMRDDHVAGAVGISLYLISSHITHDCDPNVQIVFPEGTDKAAIKALKPIAADEELHISFVDPSLDVETRRKQLQSSYRISCKCAKCEADLKAAEATPTVNADTIDPMDDSTPSFAAVAASPSPATAAAAFNSEHEKKFAEATLEQSEQAAEQAAESESPEQPEQAAEQAAEQDVEQDAEQDAEQEKPSAQDSE